MWMRSKQEPRPSAAASKAPPCCGGHEPNTAMACRTCPSVARCQSASTWRRSCGITAVAMSPVRISSPPMISGMSGRSFAMESRRALSAARSGLPGA